MLALVLLNSKKKCLENMHCRWVNNLWRNIVGVSKFQEDLCIRLRVAYCLSGLFHQMKTELNCINTLCCLQVLCAEKPAGRKGRPGLSCAVSISQS